MLCVYKPSASASRCFASAAAGAARRASPPLLVAAARRRCCLTVFASDDDEIVPILSGRKKKGFTPKEYEQLRKPQQLGGETIGDELALIRQKFLEAEQQAKQLVEAKTKSHNWDGDIYIGSRWNELSIFALLLFVIPVAGLLFAWLTFGKLWATGEFY